MNSDTPVTCDWVDEIQGYVWALRTGLNEYCGRPTRIAILTQLSAVNEPDRLIWVFDPDDLLGPHRDEMRSYFGDDHMWKPTNDPVYFGQDHSLLAPSLDGVIVIVRLIVEFDERQPRICQAKRVGKVLQAVPSGHWLVCNTDLAELNLVGIAAHDGRLPNSIDVEFRKGDAQVFVGGEQVCKIRDGAFVAAGSDIGLHTLRGALLNSVGEPCDSLCQVVNAISDSAIQTRHGCTVVLDFSEPLVELSGQRLVTPLTLSREDNSLSIAAAMSSIDGALQIDKAGQLRAFGCLLDGNRVDDERLDRGARYNSALRFARRTGMTVVVVVVSEDGLLSVFGLDGEYSGEPQLVPLHYIIPTIPLAEWLDGNPAQ